MTDAAHTPPRPCTIGVDFGTPNTVVAIARPGEAVRAVAFHDDGAASDIYRSVLCFEKLAQGRFDIEAHALYSSPDERTDGRYDLSWNTSGRNGRRAAVSPTRQV